MTAFPFDNNGVMIISHNALIHALNDYSAFGVVLFFFLFSSGNTMLKYKLKKKKKKKKKKTPAVKFLDLVFRNNFFIFNFSKMCSR